jgi:hypothetical protein
MEALVWDGPLGRQKPLFRKNAVLRNGPGAHATNSLRMQAGKNGQSLATKYSFGLWRSFGKA